MAVLPDFRSVEHFFSSPDDTRYGLRDKRVRRYTLFALGAAEKKRPEILLGTRKVR